MIRFLIWGGGGHGKVIADLIRARDDLVLGFVDADPAKVGSLVDPGGARVLLQEEEFLDGVVESGRLPGEAEAVAIAIGDNRRRLWCLERLGQVNVPALVHPSAVVSPSARVGPASVVFPGAIVNADARVGRAVIINSAAVVEHDCVIGDGAHLSPGSVLGGAVRVGERTWVGAGATIIQRVSVGSDTVVGAGAVVIRDTPSNITVVGVPARPRKVTEGH